MTYIYVYVARLVQIGTCCQYTVVCVAATVQLSMQLRSVPSLMVPASAVLLHRIAYLGGDEMTMEMTSQIDITQGQRLNLNTVKPSRPTAARFGVPQEYRVVCRGTLMQL